RHLVIILCATVLTLSCYVNLSSLVTDPFYFVFFPPFQPGLNQNTNQHLGGEHLCIAQSLAAGHGFASPFHEDTGPTAWMPPVYPLPLASLLRLCGHDLSLVAACVVALQDGTLILTGYLVLKAAPHGARRLSPAVALVLFLVSLLTSFRLCLQTTHDCWLI